MLKVWEKINRSQYGQNQALYSIDNNFKKKTKTLNFYKKIIVNLNIKNLIPMKKFMIMMLACTISLASFAQTRQDTTGKKTEKAKTTKSKQRPGKKDTTKRDTLKRDTLRRDTMRKSNP